MNQIECPVGDDGRSDKPQVSLEPDECNEQKSRCNGAFNDQCPCRASDDREENVIGSADDEYRRSERTVAIKTDTGCEPSDRQRHENTYEVFQFTPPKTCLVSLVYIGLSVDAKREGSFSR